MSNRNRVDHPSLKVRCGEGDPNVLMFIPAWEPCRSHNCRLYGENQDRLGRMFTLQHNDNPEAVIRVPAYVFNNRGFNASRASVVEWTRKVHAYEDRP